jgi:RNA polymerase sigma-70 factor (ECF subfamily)
MSDSSVTRRGPFLTTHWSLVLQARGTAPAAASLEALCRQYWPPLYAYIRQRGHAPQDAQDLTQAFFARLLEKHWLEAADPARGRFRSFLLMALKRFLTNAWDHERAQKRGGGAVFAVDPQELERLPLADPAALPGEALFDRQWALALLEAVMRRLRDEHAAAGRLAEYELLKPCLTAERGELDYTALGVVLGLTPVSARSAVHRLRKRFRDLFREEVAATVDDPAEIDDELRAVVAALGAG